MDKAVPISSTIFLFLRTFLPSFIVNWLSFLFLASVIFFLISVCTFLFFCICPEKTLKFLSFIFFLAFSKAAAFFSFCVNIRI